MAFGGLLIVQLLFGAFTAGLRAGFIHNTFPTMSGAFVPEGLWILQPFYRNFLENLVTIQFTHRVLGYAVFIFALVIGYKTMRATDRREARAGLGLAAVAVGQLLLGVATILAVVPVWLGVLHQAGAMLLFFLWVYALHVSLSSRRTAGVSSEVEVGDHRQVVADVAGVGGAHAKVAER
jgi:cytochrome c oxidase assembly protein subunit 15